MQLTHYLDHTNIFQPRPDSSSSEHPSSTLLNNCLNFTIKSDPRSSDFNDFFKDGY